jgi:pyrroloquinoline quinone (PQQ) biosynthesis protein C
MLSGQGDLLRRKIALAMPLIESPSARLWEHESLPSLFPEFLLTIYGSVRATVPLMNAAVAELRRASAEDALRDPLIDYFEQHAREEAEHEEWLIQDMAHLGIPREHVCAQVAGPAIARLVGAHYYWIHHAHPISLLGLFAVLEGHPPTLPHLDEVQRRTGLPAEAFRMLRQHAELDAVHAGELFRLIDGLPLTATQASLLGVSAFHTVDALGVMFDELIARTDLHAKRPMPAST